MSADPQMRANSPMAADKPSRNIIRVTSRIFIVEFNLDTLYLGFLVVFLGLVPVYSITHPIS